MNPAIKPFTFLAALIISFIAIAVETDLYVPAFPQMLDYFGTTEQLIQLTLSSNLIGFCLGSLIYGPLSDAFGRRKIILIGMSIFFLSSLGCVSTNSITTLICMRFFQGFGAAALEVCASAAMFDVFKKAKAAQIVSIMHSFIAGSMATAPILGSFLTQSFGWRSNFIFIASLATVAIIAISFFVPETLLLNNRKSLNFPSILKDYKKVVSSKQFWCFNGIGCLTFAAYIAFIANISLIFVNHLGVPESHLPFYQGSTTLAFVLTSMLSSRIRPYLSEKGICYTGMGIFLAGSALFYLVSILGVTNPLLLTIPTWIFTGGTGLCLGTILTKYVESNPEIKGTTCSLGVANRLGITALTIAYTGTFFNGTMKPVASVVIGSAIAIGLLLTAARKSLLTTKHA